MLSTLGWWLEAGVDLIVDDCPRDWLAAPRAAPAAAAAPVSALPDSLEALRSWLAQSDDAPFAAAGGVRLPPAGDPAGGLMLLGDMPGIGDAAAGSLFSGAEGRLLDAMLGAIGRDRASVYLATLSCVRPDGGRIDGAALARCAELAKRHVMLARPRALLLLGQAACEAMLGLRLPQARGRTHRICDENRVVNVVVTFHPQFLLQRPACKAEAWADLRRLSEGPTPS